ncbi:ricin B-like lectin R40G3 [Chenopodium quinoa]|uniref:ricin B-like lectin R40G3 n=1 Tax=Chenopodium quinoa TaxID=63459 RepID=UPI000B77C000|nr:ricin B-like lectin R40G3 [Chenopodium quinoa]
MDFPHHNHHHPGRYEEDSDEFSRPPYPTPSQPPFGAPFPHHHPQNYPPPPPSYGGGSGAGAYPHPAQVAGVYHTSHTPHMESPNYPPPQMGSGSFGSQSHHEYGGSHHLESPNYPSYGHQSSYNESEQQHHESGGDEHRFRPHMPGFIAQHFHHSPSDVSSHGHGYESNEGGSLEGYFGNKPTFKIYSKAGGDTYSVAIRDGKVVLAYSDPNDPTQHWYKDEKFSTKVKDEDGYPSFALVNKSTGQALKHSASAHPVHLVPYKPNVLDESILWTESRDLGSGFRTIRMVNNVHLVLDAFNGDKDHGGIHEGTIIALYKPWKGDNQNQQWKLYPH